MRMPRPAIFGPVELGGYSRRVDASAPVNPWLSSDVQRGAAYDDRFAELAASGAHVHGEADLVASYRPRSVLDAGCGTGRIAIELARRDIEVVGVDLDLAMLREARAKAPHLAWIAADIASLRLRHLFDVAVLAGNVMIFVTPGSEPDVLGSVCGHLRAGGLVVSGFSLRPGALDLDSFDHMAAQVGLELVDRWASWDRGPYVGSSYAVSVHRRAAPRGA